MENETVQVRILASVFLLLSSSFCLCMCGNVTKDLLIFCI